MQPAPKTADDDWRTRAEISDYRETARYDETMAYCRRLAEASEFVHIESLGRSPEGREEAGGAYVVFGDSESSDLDVADLGERGYAIQGAAPVAQPGVQYPSGLGVSASAGGDVNGDGTPDIVTVPGPGGRGAAPSFTGTVGGALSTS